MPHPFAERSGSRLEMEMNTTKDTIWRLTNRVCYLEGEFKRLKNLIKRHIGLEPSPVVQSTKSLTKARKIFHNKKQQEESVTIENTDVVIKGEVESASSESSDNDMTMNDCSMSGIDTDEDNINNDDDGEYSGFSSDSGDSHEDNKTQIRIKTPKELFDRDGRRKSGRKKGNIWTRFKKVDVVSENGRQTTITICKYCKTAVSARGTRLKKHLEKCIISLKDPFGIPENVALKKDQPNESVVVNEANIVTAEVNDIDYAAIAAEAASLNPEKAGRKRTPIWRHFIRKPRPQLPDQPARKYAVIAICKICQGEVSAKVVRMKIHLQKCIAGVANSNSKSPKYLTKSNYEEINKILFSPSPTSLKPDVPQSSNSTESAIVASTQSAKTQNLNSVPVRIDNADAASDCANSTTTVNVSSGDKPTNKRKISESDASAKESSFTGLLGRKASAVWQYYNITNEKKDGRVSITAACKYCNKIVSAKPVRLEGHLKKCNKDQGTE